MSGARRRESERSAVIIAAVEAGADSIGAVCRLTGYSTDYISGQLSALAHEGKLRRVGHGLYAVPLVKTKPVVNTKVSETGIRPIPLHRLMGGRA